MPSCKASSTNFGFAASCSQAADLYRLFIELRSQWRGTGDTCLDRLLEHEEFDEKLLDATRTAIARRGSYGALEDTMQEVRVKLLKDFRLTGCRSWQDRGRHAFLGWIWTLCYRMAHKAMDEAGTGAEPLLESIAEPSREVPMAVYHKARAIVLETIRQLPSRQAEVMRLWLAGDTREDSAARLGITENWVSKCRGQGFDAIIERLRNELPDFMGH